MADSVTIDGRTYEYSLDEETGRAVLSRDSVSLEVTDWTWGAKNDVLSRCTVYSDRTGELEVDAARYYEAMLSRCIAAYRVDDEERDFSEAALRALPAGDGDHLAALVQFVVEGATTPPEVDLESGPGTSTLTVDGMIFELREWTWGEKNDVSAASIQYQPTSDAYAVDVALFNELMLCACITKAPFDIDRRSLRALPARIGDLLLDEAQRLSVLDDGVKKNSAKSSAAAAATRR